MRDDDSKALARLHFDLFGGMSERRGATETAPAEDAEDAIAFDRDWSDPIHDRGVLIRTIRFWGEHAGWQPAVMLLVHLSTVSRRDAVSALAQAFWIAIGAELPVASTLRVAMELTKAIGIEDDAAPLIIAMTWLMAQSSPDDESGQYGDMAMSMLTACGLARASEPEEFTEWMNENVFLERRDFERRLTAKLEAMVPADDWCFDRAELPLFS